MPTDLAGNYCAWEYEKNYHNATGTRLDGSSIFDSEYHTQEKGRPYKSPATTYTHASHEEHDKYRFAHVIASVLIVLGLLAALSSPEAAVPFFSGAFLVYVGFFIILNFWKILVVLIPLALFFS